MSIGFWVSALVMIVSARAADPKVIFVMGGDVQWSLTLRPPSVKFDAPDAGDPDWRASPRVTLKQNKPDHDAYAIRYKLQFDSPGEMLHYPLLRLAPTLRAADLVFF